MTAEKTAATILVVDDDAGVRSLLKDCFALDGYRVLEAADGREMLAQLERERIDLITLDLTLGGDNGFDLARQVRAQRDVPIIMITGKGDAIDRIVGLELGADDYITKPFHLREVLARVHAVLRRYEAVLPDTRTGSALSAGRRLAFDGLVLDVDRRELRTEAGELRELTTAEFNLLLVLLERPARVLSRDAIMDLLKGQEWSPFDRSIDSLVVRLRRKIEPVPDSPRLIKTVRGVGYVMAAEVRSG
jgi:DNA-binding response OmpR family regulator